MKEQERSREEPKVEDRADMGRRSLGEKVQYKNRILKSDFGLKILKKREMEGGRP